MSWIMLMGLTGIWGIIELKTRMQSAGAALIKLSSQNNRTKGEILKTTYTQNCSKQAWTRSEKALERLCKCLECQSYLKEECVCV